jgi:transcriptional regulator of acetoin/glycerol metabolism
MFTTGDHSNSGATSSSVIFSKDGHVRSFNEIEREVLLAALERYRGNAFNISQVLGIARSTLYRRFSYHRLDPGSFRQSPKVSFG